MNWFFLICFSIFNSCLYYLNNIFLDYLNNVDKNEKNRGFISNFIVDNFVNRFIDFDSSVIYNLFVLNCPFVFIYLNILLAGFLKFYKFDIKDIFINLMILLLLIFVNNLFLNMIIVSVNIFILPFYIFIYLYSKKCTRLKSYKQIPIIKGKIFVDN